MVSESTAFCPGHITAFFEVCEDADILKRGSRGAGLCLSRGVISTVRVRDSSQQEILVYMNGRLAKGSVTELALRKWLGNLRLRIEVNAVNQLPVSQGFGLSAAGALSSLIALRNALGSDVHVNDLVRTVHIAEVESLTGLGDVHAEAVGGLVVRERPGAPPYGKLRRTDLDCELVLCIVGERLATSRILRDKSMVKRIIRSGREKMDSFLSNIDIERLFILNQEFAKETRLASEVVLKAIENCESYGYAGMVMLGNSIFAYGDADALERTLSRFGQVIRCEVDNRGARGI